MEISEELLHHVWKHRLFRSPLVDLDELPIDLVDPGQHNRDSGPDFFNARIRSEGILWAGNVEIHKKASEWYQHGHHLDPAFDNVILHVVLVPDCQVYNSRGRAIRTVGIELLPGATLHGMEGTDHGMNRLGVIYPARLRTLLEPFLMERYREKAARIGAELKRCGGDWDEVFYRSLARAFGHCANTQPFEMLSRSVPLKTILKYGRTLIAREAILFGQAGMLGPQPGISGPGTRKGQTQAPELCEDEYLKELRERYRRLPEKLDLSPMDGFIWKYLRLRPGNFPTVRISQLACMLGHYEEFFRLLPGHPDPLDFLMKLELRASGYWTTHYRFQRGSPRMVKTMGRDRKQVLFMNAVLPFLYAGSKIRELPECEPDVPGFLRRIPAEDNRIIRFFKSQGVEVPDGYISQALLQVFNKYRNFKT